MVGAVTLMMGFQIEDDENKVMYPVVMSGMCELYTDLTECI